MQVLIRSQRVIRPRGVLYLFGKGVMWWKCITYVQTHSPWCARALTEQHPAAAFCVNEISALITDWPPEGIKVKSREAAVAKSVPPPSMKLHHEIYLSSTLYPDFIKPSNMETLFLDKYKQSSFIILPHMVSEVVGNTFSGEISKATHACWVIVLLVFNVAMLSTD